MSILDKLVSYYPSIKTTESAVNVNLLTLLQSDKHKDRILLLRRSASEIQKELKKELPCYTIAGTFSRRSESGLIQLSGLACVDLDSAQDYNLPYVLSEMKKLSCVAYAGLSCSGTRIYCIVNLKFPDKYKQHYERLIKSFTNWGLPMGDECHKKLSQPRFVSWNEPKFEFFNHDAIPYDQLAPARTFHYVKRQAVKPVSIPPNAFDWCVEQINKSHSFQPAHRHDYIIRLTRYCNLKGLSEEVTLDGCMRFTEIDFPATEIMKMVKHIYATQSNSFNKHPFKSRLNVNDDLATTDPVSQTTIKEGKIQQSKLIESGPHVDVIDPAIEKSIHEINEFFTARKFNTKQIQLNDHTTIQDLPKFIHGHLKLVNAKWSSVIVHPYLERLIQVRDILTHLEG